jgi:hypothetical protein
MQLAVGISDTSIGSCQATGWHYYCIKQLAVIDLARGRFLLLLLQEPPENRQSYKFQSSGITILLKEAAGFHESYKSQLTAINLSRGSSCCYPALGRKSPSTASEEAFLLNQSQTIYI